MLKTFLNFTAPSEWYFQDPDHLEKQYYGSDKAELIMKILAYREQNGLPEIFELGAVIDNFLCNQKSNLGKCGKNSRIQRSWWQYMHGGMVLLKNMLIKNPVNQKTADVRSGQCAGCKFNVFPDKARFVKWSDRVAEASVPGKRSAFHPQLGNCEVCTCPLRAKVWMPRPFTLSEEEKAKMAEVSCWQLEDKE